MTFKLPVCLTGFALGMAIVARAGDAEAWDCPERPIVLRSSHVAGQVFGADAAPIAGATVTIVPGGGPVLYVETDANGYFEAPVSWPGRGSIEVSAQGYTSFRLKTYIDAGLPFQQVVVRLDMPISCGNACSILLPSPTRLRKPPPCLGIEGHDDWAFTNKRLDRTARQCAAGKKSACQSLARAAAGHRDSSVRFAAVARLADEDLLLRIARDDKDRDVRQAAQDRLEKLLKERKELPPQSPQSPPR